MHCEDYLLNSCRAIKIKLVSNYNDEINNIINSLNLDENNEVQNSIMHHKDLFLSAFMSLKSIEKYTELKNNGLKGGSIPKIINKGRYMRNLKVVQISI